jgi:nicotinate-nucleotide--dimethylbenzimidazole phosphoribosyltransferase
MNLLKKTLEEINPLYNDTMEKAWKKLDNLTKPIGSLGRLEEVAAQMAGITGKLNNTINKKNIVIMCADNGVIEEGYSSNPQCVTEIVTNNFTRDITGVYVLAKLVNSEMTVVDIGVNADFNNKKIIDRKIAYGTKNIAKGPAMRKEELIKAIEVGIEIVDNLAMENVDLLGTGEMGVGNTTTSSAILTVLSGLDIELTVGKGAGLTEDQFKKKKAVIERAIEINFPDKEDVLDVMMKVGGFDIAGLCGCFLGAAKNRIPIVIDGFIASTAALCAYRLCNNTRYFMIPSHLSKEPGARYIMEELALEPYLNLDMRLGEGSGCPLAFNVVQAAVTIMNKMGTFEDASLDKDDYVDIRNDQ